MKKKPPSSQINQTSKPSRKERTGIDRLYKYTGARKVSFYYQHPDGKSETLASSQLGDRKAIAAAELTAKRRAIDILEGKVIVGSVGDMIDRFVRETAPTHFLDQSKDGIAVRASSAANLTRFFGTMAPKALTTHHGYQFLKARAAAGAPAKANKELALMSTICHYAVREGIMELNPFTGMMLNRYEKDVRVVSRRQILRFYLWSLHQGPKIRNLGCAAMFTYLTGFRASEVRPFHVSGLERDGVRVISAKRKMGETEVTKLREWSTRLRTVVARSKQTHTRKVDYLFANSSGKEYSRSGWGAVWQDAMFAWIASFDHDAASALSKQKEWELAYKAAYDKGERAERPDLTYRLVDHPAYFSLQDVRPAAITTKLRNRDKDAYDFAAHANPGTTHRHYDRRNEKRARATE